MHEAERAQKIAQLAAQRIERTLHSWRVSQAEIDEIHFAAQRDRAVAANERRLQQVWGEIEVRAPFDGLVLEENITVGDMVDAECDLFKIGDVSKLGVAVEIGEDTLPALEAMNSTTRQWTVYPKSSPDAISQDAVGIAAPIETIGHAVDPGRHTVCVTGWLDNAQGLLQPGQSVIAEITLK